MPDEAKRRLVRAALHHEMLRRGIVRMCKKCNSVGDPCAYPDYEYRDCPVAEERGYGSALVKWAGRN